MENYRQTVLNVQRSSASQANIVNRVTLTGNKYILSSTMFVLLYPANEVVRRGGVYWFHHDCLWKNCFCMITPFFF